MDVNDLSIENQLAHYKHREQELLQQNALNEDNFSKKRAKFMDLFKTTEGMLKNLFSSFLYQPTCVFS